jgi:hypothetical protein
LAVLLYRPPAYACQVTSPDEHDDGYYSGLVARHEPQNFTGPDAERIREFFADPPPRPAPLEGLTFLPDQE